MVISAVAFAADPNALLYPVLISAVGIPISFITKLMVGVKTEHDVAPALMKLDVQGSELDVLTGSTGILDPVEIIIMECAILEYNKGVPQLEDSISYMKRLGFSPLDVFDLTRGKDGALFHMDLVFVREDSSLLPTGILW